MICLVKLHPLCDTILQKVLVILNAHDDTMVQVGNSSSLYLIFKPLGLGFCCFLSWLIFFKTKEKGVRDIPFENFPEFSFYWSIHIIIRDLQDCKILRNMNIWIWYKVSGLTRLQDLVLQAIMLNRKRMTTRYSRRFVLPGSLCARCLD